jgi:hypothetical protein
MQASDSEKNRDNYLKTVDIYQAAKILGQGVTSDNIHARIRRGTLKAYQDDDGEWHIPTAELNRIQQELENCGNCTQPATSFIIVKYHNHVRVEFILCENCGTSAEKAYSKNGGVLEVVSYPIRSEGWMRY